MKRTLIKWVLRDGKPGDHVTICGWVKSRRDSKGIAFLTLNDGSTQDSLQLVIPESSPAFTKASHMNTGSALQAEGLVTQSPGKGQHIELDVSEIILLGDADPGSYPLQKKGHSLEFLREIGHLRTRSNTFGAMFRVRNVLSAGIHDFFQGRDFIWIHTPIITASDCEGAGDLFTVTSLPIENMPRINDGGIDFSQDFFGRRAYLTVSGQLQAEFMALSLGNVYTFGPTFRAENSNTSRHLSEFWMVEPEISFADLQDDMQLAEEFFRSLCKAVIDQCPQEISFFEKFYKNTSLEALQKLSEQSFAHLTYTDAVHELQKSGEKFEFQVQWGMDLQSEHERYLTEKVIGGPVIVTDYPKDIKAFYMRLNDDEKTVAAMDVLVPGIGEIIGGSQREERLDVLEKRISNAGISPDSMQWYLDLRRFGSAPHAGFGLGLERLVQYITGMHNIRDVIPCPRAPKLISF